MREMFGPVIYVVATDSTEESLALAAESAREKGAITWLVYTTDEDVAERAVDAAVEGGVPVAFNLSGGLYVNQSAAFSDFHVTGHNPAGNASLTITDDGPGFVPDEHAAALWPALASAGKETLDRCPEELLRCEVAPPPVTPTGSTKSSKKPT